MRLIMRNIDKILGSENAMSSITDAISYLLMLANERGEENVEVELHRRTIVSTNLRSRPLLTENKEE
jgi:hypothetical protein